MTIDLKSLSAHELWELIKEAKVLLEAKDKVTKAQIKANVIYAKAGQSGRSLRNKPEPPKSQELLEAEQRLADLEAYILRLEAGEDD